jgi:hypothetical protein
MSKSKKVWVADDDNAIRIVLDESRQKSKTAINALHLMSKIFELHFFAKEVHIKRVQK